MDRLVVLLGAVMIALTTYVAVTTEPPVGDARRQSVAPETISFLAITSVIGASYTSTSFLKVLGPWVSRYERQVVCGFIAVSAAAFLALGKTPVGRLIFAGAFDGLILPLGLGLLLWVAARRCDLLGGYRYPRWLIVIGSAAWLVTVYLGARSLTDLGKLF